MKATKNEDFDLLRNTVEPLLVHNNFLVAPLNWGLGHAARCIPIIDQLLFHKKNVFLASDGAALKLLTSSYPDLKFYNLPSYGITYPYDSIVLNMIKNSLNILFAIKSEHKFLQELLINENIDVILSDNRYGIYHEKYASIFICHQLQLLHPNPIIRRLAAGIHRKLLGNFSEFWIPDRPPPESIAPELSKPFKLSDHKYIGILSRMIPMQSIKTRKYLVILSGPEPKRTELEKVLLECLPEKSFLMVRGKNEDQSKYRNEKNIVNFLTHRPLSEEIGRSEYVVCRSGYTSIMDLIKLKQKAILIPTPGQTEQEYLALSVTEKYPAQFVLLPQHSVYSYPW